MASDGIIPIFVANFLYQNASFVASNIVMYSAFMVESTITVCLELFQLTAPSLHTNRLLDVDFRSSISDIKFESVNPRLGVLHYQKPMIYP